MMNVVRRTPTENVQSKNKNKNINRQERQGAPFLSFPLCPALAGRRRESRQANLPQINTDFHRNFHCNLIIN